MVVAARRSLASRLGLASLISLISLKPDRGAGDGWAFAGDGAAGADVGTVGEGGGLLLLLGVAAGVSLTRAEGKISTTKHSTSANKSNKGSIPGESADGPGEGGGVVTEEAAAAAPERRVGSTIHNEDSYKSYCECSLTSRDA